MQNLNEKCMDDEILNNQLGNQYESLDMDDIMEF